jgi:hypothetical protein
MTASRGHVPGWVSPTRPTLGYGLVAWPTSAGTPDDGRLGPGGPRPDVWLARWLDDGWRREYPWTGTEVVINGQLVHRFALICDAKR